MVPQIRVKYRTKENVKYAIEQFSGKQFRCLKCNSKFYTDKELFQHINKCKSVNPENKHIKLPRINDSVKAILLYTEDVKDDLKQKYLKGVNHYED